MPFKNNDPNAFCKECGRKDRLHTSTICRRCYQNNRHKKKGPALCHPERKAHAGGLCRECYNKTGKAQMAICHPDRRQVARGLCRECYRKHPEIKANAVKARRLKKYGLTDEQYIAILQRQGWMCAICCGKADVVDHNHKTGEVRGLLCGTCNHILGRMRDRIDFLYSAASYLRCRGSYGDEGPWMQSMLGQRVYLLAPLAEQMSIDEIAVSLSRIPRFLGHTKRAYSVAQHSVFVSEYCDDYPLAGLLHDAHEAYIGDIPTPVKAALEHEIGPAFSNSLRRIAHGFDVAICFAHGCDPGDIEQPQVKYADLVALATERRDLMVEPPGEKVDWSCLAGISPAAEKIIPLDEFEARDLFLARYHELIRP